MARYALMLRAIRIFLGAASLLPATAGARTPPSPTADAVITGSPRAWALAATALLAYRNQERIDMLPPDARDASKVAETRGILHDWWGIDSRADLLRTLEWLDREGHRAEFQRVGRWLGNMTDAQYRASLSAARSRPGMAGGMKLVHEYYPKHGGSSLVAWDYCRYIMLCRWGYMVGFLTEAQAWRRIMPAARRIQGAFHSWAELGEDYLVGREFWSSEETGRTGRIYRDIQTRLVGEPRSPWRQLPWQMNLGPDTPSRRR